MLGLAPHAAALRKVKVRSALADVLQVRQRFERALVDVEWMPPGLPPSAILLVRRLSPARREGTVSRASFGELVSIALREQASRARRPWLHADATDAEAVLFEDEAELIACLARDWLHGLVADRWWWRNVLLDASPHAWLRRDVLCRAERLVPAIAMLATRGEATAFIARLEAADCAQAIAAIARSHAVPLAGVHEEPATAPSSERVAGAIAVSLDDFVSAVRSEAVRRLMHEVPELRHESLNGAQRRLLALALALTRAPTWARTPSVAVGLEALDSVETIELVRFPKPVSVSAHGRSAIVAPAQGTAAFAKPHSGASEPHGESDSVDSAPAATVTAIGRRPVGAIASPEGTKDWADASEPGESQRHVPAQKASMAKECIAPATTAAAPPSWITDMSNAVDATTAASPAPPRESTPYPAGAAPHIATQFGGLFYLLNAALALEFYGDFTAPRSHGLALSPWDWLAMVGRAWFGDEIIADRVWGALAGLAGRTPEEEPGRDFQPPSQDWLSDNLAMLRARIALAVDGAEDDDLPALVCRHEAGIEITAGTVHVHLALRDLPLAIRIAGLDRDPGWIPAAGRDIRFHFA